MRTPGSSNNGRSEFSSGAKTRGPSSPYKGPQGEFRSGNKPPEPPPASAEDAADTPLARFNAINQELREMPAREPGEEGFEEEMREREEKRKEADAIYKPFEDAIKPIVLEVLAEQGLSNDHSSSTKLDEMVTTYAFHYGDTDGLIEKAKNKEVILRMIRMTRGEKK